jgi:hypothetical protein
MAFTRPGKATRCAGCGKTGAEKQGANNWKCVTHVIRFTVLIVTVT